MRVLGRPSLPDRRAARLVALAAAPAAHPSELPGALAARVAAALRAALAECGRSEPAACAPVSPGLAAAVRDVVDAARAAGIVYGEQLLIALKRAWTTLPDVQALPPGGAREAAWDQLVALCVQAFYAPVRSGSDTARVLRLVPSQSDQAIQP